MTQKTKDIEKIVKQRCINAIDRKLEPHIVDGVTTLITVVNMARMLEMDGNKLYIFRKNEKKRRLFLKDVYKIAEVTGVPLEELLEGFLSE